MKLCIATCYSQPDYVRAVTLRAAARSLGHEVVVVKNRRTGPLRYLETPIKLLLARLRHRPDAYLLTFRGYEVLPTVRLITLGRPLIFDEFINAYAWAVLEHHKVAEGGIGARVLMAAYRSAVRSADRVLLDTPSHADFSAELLNLPPEKFSSVIVGTDEETFVAQSPGERRPDAEPLRVFYYATMLPLHGLSFVLEAARQLAGRSLSFEIVGGGDEVRAACGSAAANGVDIVHRDWIDYADLPAAIAAADVCLAGPFGNTSQSRFVVTGKAYQFLRMGKPVIVGANAESSRFTDKRDAIVVEQGSAEALARALAWADEHRGDLAGIGQAGRELYERSMSLREVERELARVLDSVV